MSEPGEPEPRRSQKDTLGGTIGGQKFQIETQHLISVLLIIVIAGAMYFQIQHTAELLTQMQRNADAQIGRLQGEHEQMFERMRIIGNALRVVDWNQNRPVADRVPIDLPAAMFEDYRRQAEPTEPARRRSPPPKRETREGDPYPP